MINTLCEFEEINKTIGCMIGMPIGDACGHPFEFIPLEMVIVIISKITILNGYLSKINYFCFL